ncbi:hypothetical protein [Streptomyces sp. MUSC 1]|uniref:Uncharacterized protein n=1 Tax=Streptomyces monashensis TaxID=1678012 RepID=A0A1S2QRK2_9ACTN|nr:hypothetical protein BIV23_00485 [Streptomyces monashensis]
MLHVSFKVLTVDGEFGKRHGNETIRVTPDVEVSIKLPVSLAGHANSKHGRYVLPAKGCFAHRGAEWRVRRCDSSGPPDF